MPLCNRSLNLKWTSLAKSMQYKCPSSQPTYMLSGASLKQQV